MTLSFFDMAKIESMARDTSPAGIAASTRVCTPESIKNDEKTHNKSVES